MGKLALNLRWVLVPALLALGAGAWAQVQITARVDQDAISRDDMVELTVAVAGNGLNSVGEPTLPPMKDFQVVGSSTQQSISVINGAMQSSTNYVYQLQPTRTGTLTIPAATLKVRGHTYRTDPINITVTPGTGRANPALPGSPGSLFGPNFGQTPSPGSSPGKSADVKHTVDHKTAYVGQQITYTFAFMQSEQLFGDVHYSPADTPGFVAEELPNPPQTTETINGRAYAVQRRLKALFATSAGHHTIGQAGVTATMDPTLGPEELVANAIPVEILPLPENGRPAGFSGAVGSFSVRVRVDRPVVRAGETVNCTIEVTGDGNIRSFGAPELPLPDWVRVYKAGDKRTVRPGGGGGGPNDIGGTATFSYLLLPRQAGNLRLGPVAFSDFDPIARTYRTTTSEGVDVTVTPGSATAAPVVPTDNLRPIRASLGRAPGRPLVSHVAFWVIIALPLLVVLWTVWQYWQDVRVQAAPQQARAGNALALAQKRFDVAAQALAAGNRDAYYAGLHEALLDYIADRTTAPPSGLTADIAYDLLMAYGAYEDLAELTRTLVERTAAGRFAPGGSDPAKAGQLVNECRQVVAALQRQVRPDA